MSASRPERRAAILAELEAVCAGPVFAKSPGLTRLLRFLVERELAGEAGHLRETYIGSALYGRDRHYDPKLDGIVRVNANRLRTRLEEQYWRYPASRIQFVLRRGSYVPVYRFVTPEEERQPGGSAEAVPDRLQQVPVADVERRPHPGDSAGSPEPVLAGAGTKGKPPWVWAAAFVAAACVFLVIARWTRHREAGGRAEYLWTSRPLTRFDGAQEFPAFSPNGRTVAFVWTGGSRVGTHIYLQSLNGDAPERLTAGTEDDTRPAWSPDGGSIAYVRLLGEGHKLVVVRNLATTAERTVAAIEGRTPWLCALPRLAWSPDGRTLYTSAVPTGAEGPPSEICGLIALDVATGARRALTRTVPGVIGDVEAAVSPDGRSVAWMRSFNYLSSDLFSVPVTGGSASQLTSDDNGILGFSWDAGGRSLIVSSRRVDGQARLWRMPLGDGPPEQMTDGSVGPWLPATTAQGDKVVFTVFRSITKVWRQNASGREELVGYGTSNSKPQLSPDGKQVLYTGEHSGSLELWTTDVPSRQTRQLTHLGGYPAMGARWSPDGRRIVFECRDQHRSGICLIAADGQGGAHQIAASTANQIQPSWSRDGRLLYYASDATGRWEIYRQPVAGGTAVQVTFNGGMRALESWDGRFLYVHRGEPRGGLLKLAVASIGRGPLAEERTVFLPVPDREGIESWGVGKEGVLVLEKSNGKGPATIVLYPYGSGKRRMLYTTSGLLSYGAFSVSEDGRTICYVTEEARTGELDLLERQPRP